MKFKLIMLFICLFGVKDSFAMEGKRITLLLPVNHVLPAENRVTLAVTVPAHYKSLNNLRSAKVEFIPQSDSNPHKWSEIITTHLLVGSKIAAGDFLKNLREVIIKHDGVVLDSTGKEDPHYNLKKIAMVYHDKDRRELLYAQYASGPYDCVGVQYAIALTDQIDIVAALAKAEEFMKNHVQLIVGNRP